MFKRFKENPIPFVIKESVNIAVIVVGYRLWTNKPLTTFDKITFTIGLLAIGFTVSALGYEPPMIIEGAY